MSQSVVKNLVMIVILMFALAGILWRWTSASRERRPPDTPESTTIWVCEKCGHTEEYTARQLSDALEKASLVRTTQTAAKRTSVRETLLVCSECKAASMVCGNKCIVCGKGILDSVNGMCEACAKAQKPAGRGR